MSEKAKLLAEIERFLTATSMAPARFGVEALNNPAFVLRLRSGERKTVSIDTAERVRRYIKDHSKPRRRKPKHGAELALAS